MNLLEIERASSDYERFLSKITVTQSGCWEKTGKKDKDGYKFFSISGRDQRAHRYSYEIHKGKIPEGLVIDHLCKNEGCCNPDHLEVVTVAENNRRGELITRLKEWHSKLNREAKFKHGQKASLQAVKNRIAKPDCKNGHLWTKETTYINPSNKHRKCRTCMESHTRAIARKEQQEKARLENTHCNNGHLRSAENTYTEPKSGHKKCKLCMYARNKIYRLKIKEN
jgi:hypothetical protein